MSKLNIIVSVKNMAADDRLRICLDSLINQSFEDMMVIAVDDCSNDDSANILKEYASKYPNKIKAYFMEDEMGIGGAKNKGLIEANSEWIAFTSGNDEIDKNYYESLMAKASHKDVDVVASPYAVNKKGEIIEGEECNPYEYELEGQEIIQFLLVNPGRLENKIYKRSIFYDNGIWFPTNKEYENLGAMRLALVYSKNYEYVDDVKYTVYSQGKDVDVADLYDRIDVMTFFIEECYKRELFMDFAEEIEAAYIDDMYVSTLFKYMDITQKNKRQLSFIMMLRDGILDCFPEYDTNPYFWEKYDDEVKDLVAMHCEHPKKFMKSYL